MSFHNFVVRCHFQAFFLFAFIEAFHFFCGEREEAEINNKILNNFRNLLWNLVRVSPVVCLLHNFFSHRQYFMLVEISLLDEVKTFFST